MSDTDLALFTDYRSDVVGFESTWLLDRTLKLTDKVVNTDPIPENCTQSTETQALIDVGIQTDSASKFEALGNEQQLANWINRIYPIMDRELNKGPTRVFDMIDQDSTANQLHVTAHQVISTLKHHQDISSQSEPRKGCVAWMSLSTMNAPILAVSDCVAHSTWCVHADSELNIFVPIRTSSGVHYERTQVLPVMSCISTLCTNSFHKDMLAGGTFAGDIVIWCYERTHQFEGLVSEHSSETSQFGCVVGLDWMQPNSLKGEWYLLSAHVDGIIVVWKVTERHVVKDKLFAIKPKSSTPKILARLTTIATLTSTEFVVGTDMGQVLLCSISSSSSSGTNTTDDIDPVISELQPHKFAVNSLQRINFNRKTCLVSCDVSGEVLIRNSTEDLANSWQILKIPMELSNRIVCTNDLSSILAVSDNGAVEICCINGPMNIKSIPGQCTGKGNTVAISSYGCWAITGCYNGGQFQVFSIQNM